MSGIVRAFATLHLAAILAVAFVPAHVQAQGSSREDRQDLDRTLDRRQMERRELERRDLERQLELRRIERQELERRLEQEREDRDRR